MNKKRKIFTITSYIMRNICTLSFSLCSWFPLLWELIWSAALCEPMVRNICFSKKNICVLGSTFAAKLCLFSFCSLVEPDSLLFCLKRDKPSATSAQISPCRASSAPRPITTQLHLFPLIFGYTQLFTFSLYLHLSLALFLPFPHCFGSPHGCAFCFSDYQSDR